MFLKENRVYFEDIIKDEKFIIENSNIEVNIEYSNRRSFGMMCLYGKLLITIPLSVLKIGYIGRSFYLQLCNSLEKIYMKIQPLNIEPITLNYVYLFGEKLQVTNFKGYINEPKYFYVKRISFASILKQYDKVVKDKLLSIMDKDCNLLKLENDFKQTISFYKTRYGSINTKERRIHLDRRIFAFNYDVFNSVILHELCHCYYQNHSRQFHNLLNSVSSKNKFYTYIMAKGDFQFYDK